MSSSSCSCQCRSAEARARLDAGDVDAELREPHGVAEALLLAPGNHRGKSLWIGGELLRRNFGNVDLGHAPPPPSCPRLSRASTPLPLGRCVGWAKARLSNISA